MKDTKPLIEHKKIPITVIQGFLGAGKTTLLNYILNHNQGMNIGVVVNDFGDINIDSELVKSKTDKKLELTSGCICCSLQTLDLQEAIDQFTYSGSNIDYIIIEASGLAEPRDLAMTLKQTIGVRVRLDGIVTVLDAHNLTANAKDHSSIARDQLLFTDFVVINKVDLASKQQLGEVRDMIASFSPKARVLESENGKIDVRLILDQDQYKVRSQLEKDKADHDHRHHSHLHEHYSTFSWTSQKPLDPMKLQEFINRKIPANVYRAKGFIDFGTKGHMRKYIFQLVGARPEIVWENWKNVRPETKLVFIGRDIDEAKISSELKKCIDSDPDGSLPEGIELQLPQKAEF
ncbi:MAG: GTP-binding protein [Candidatus Saccharibacteria bacterium]